MSSLTEEEVFDFSPRDRPSLSAAGAPLPTAVMRSRLEIAKFSEYHNGFELRKKAILASMKLNLKMSIFEWLEKLSLFFAK